MNVPRGHVLAASKWQGSQFGSFLHGHVKVIYEDSLGEVDFVPTPSTGVVFLMEPDLISNTTFKRKLAKLRKANKMSILVLAERTSTTTQYYSGLQKFCMLELGFNLIPVPGCKEAASLLATMVQKNIHDENNPFTKKKRSLTQSHEVLESLRCIPSVGDVKVKMLLEKFGGIKGICEASVEDLSKLIGKSCAIQVQTFFMGNT